MKLTPGVYFIKILTCRFYALKFSTAKLLFHQPFLCITTIVITNLWIFCNEFWCQMLCALCQNYNCKSTGRKAASRKFMQLTPRVNFTNILFAAFTLIDPKSIKNTVKSSVSLYLLGSARVNAVSRTLMKMSPGVNVTSLLAQMCRTVIGLRHSVSPTKLYAQLYQ